jgi:hypothetical protein
MQLLGGQPCLQNHRPPVQRRRPTNALASRSGAHSDVLALGAMQKRACAALPPKCAHDPQQLAACVHCAGNLCVDVVVPVQQLPSKDPALRRKLLEELSSNPPAQASSSCCALTTNPTHVPVLSMHLAAFLTLVLWAAFAEFLGGWRQWQLHRGSSKAWAS